jgi:AcrR family transcriptional regulator
MRAEAPVKPIRARRKPRGRFHHGDLAEQLVIAAIERVETKGHTAFSMKELGQRVGVSDAAIYRHYASRDDLLAEVALRGLERFLGSLVDALQSERDPFDATLAMGMAYVRFCHANPGWFRLHFSRAWSEQLARRPSVMQRLAIGETFRQRFLAVLARMIPPGDDRTADLYRLVWGTAHGLATFVVERVFQLVQTDEERIAAADEALRMLVQSLVSRSSRESSP